MIKQLWNKYVDPKKIVTDLIRVSIIGIFLILWGYLDVIQGTLWSALKYSIPVPVIPTILLWLITQYFLHKGLVRYQIKYGKKGQFNIARWDFTTDKTHPQWTSYKEVDLMGGLLIGVKCSVNLKTNYLRFGFKLLEKSAQTLGTGGILTNENNGLFHLCKAINDNKIFVTSYKNGLQDGGPGNDFFAGTYSANTPIKVELRVDDSNNLEFFVNGNLAYQTAIKTVYRERLLILAWGDDKEYEMTVENIEVVVTK